MIRTTYAKQEFFMPGPLSENYDVVKFRDRIFNDFFRNDFPK